MRVKGTKWSVQWAIHGTLPEQDMLNAGWEPFAVDGQTIWYRRVELIDAAMAKDPQP